MIDTLKKAFSMLPKKMNTQQAAQEVLAICFQESDMLHRRQIGGGPGRGLAQFEKGDRVSRAGVWGVMNHDVVGPLAKEFCLTLGVTPTVDKVYNELEFNDVLAFGLARLLLWSSPKALPRTEVEGWDLYISVWRPGKPRREKWPMSWRQAQGVVDGQ